MGMDTVNKINAFLVNVSDYEFTWTFTYPDFRNLSLEFIIVSVEIALSLIEYVVWLFLHARDEDLKTVVQWLNALHVGESKGGKHLDGLQHLCHFGQPVQEGEQANCS